MGTHEARGRDYIDVEFRFLFPSPKDRLMAEAQELLALSPELSLLKGPTVTLNTDLKSCGFGNGKTPRPFFFFFHKLLEAQFELLSLWAPRS